MLLIMALPHDTAFMHKFSNKCLKDPVIYGMRIAQLDVAVSCGIYELYEPHVIVSKNCCDFIKLELDYFQSSFFLKFSVLLELYRHF